MRSLERGVNQASPENMKILVCDDSITVRKKLAQLLYSIMDCEVIEAVNGQEAIALYEDNNPELVFMDIVMPFMDGLEALEKIVAKDPDAKVIMLSSVGTKKNLQKALKSGAIDFVQKPCEEEQLRIAIRSHLKEGE